MSEPAIPCAICREGGDAEHCFCGLMRDDDDEEPEEDTMTDEELDALEATAKAATQGPWVKRGAHVDVGDGYVCVSVEDPSQSRLDAAHIAAFGPVTVQRLMNELRDYKDAAWLFKNKAAFKAVKKGLKQARAGEFITAQDIPQLEDDDEEALR